MSGRGGIKSLLRYASGIASGTVLALGLLLMPGTARADAGLQLNPLRYDDVLSTDVVKNGYIDVSNPSDTTITVSAKVRGFKQADLDGNLVFFDDAQLTAGIIPGLTTFNLGPREAIRVVFSVDPKQIPRGGVYAAIFFQTVPAVTTGTTTFINETTNVGTLLMLQNGGSGVKTGQIASFSLPFLQTGAGLDGQVVYRNTNRNTGGVAFTPTLTSNVLPWGQGATLTGPFIMPSSARQFDFKRPGSYFGLLPVTLHDQQGGAAVTRWVFACTGWYQWLLLVLVIALVLYLVMRRRPRKAWTALILRRVRQAAAKLLRRRHKTEKRNIDGLSRKRD